MTVRLRQVALVARDLEPAVSELCGALGIEIGFRDPGVAEFGLVNAVMPVGDTFLEVVSPSTGGTTAGRLLDKRDGDGGYMVIVQVDDIAAARARLGELGVRVVWRHDGSRAAGTHVHPKDVGGAILSIDWMDPADSWAWGGPGWKDHVRTDRVRTIAGVELQASDPAAMARRWAEVLGQDVAADGTTIELDGGGVLRFVDDRDGRGDGVGGIDLTATDRADAGRTMTLCGTRVRLV